MGIREKINRNPAITTGVTIAIIVIALVYIIFTAIPKKPKMVKEMYYTNDDGKTYFPGDISAVLPLVKDGKEAYKVYVFTCDGGKTKWVGYMQRPTARAKKMLTDYMTKKGVKDIADLQKSGEMNPEWMMLQETIFQDMEVRKPSWPANVWATMAQKDGYMQATDVKCPDGTTKNLDLVMP